MVKKALTLLTLLLTISALSAQSSRMPKDVNNWLQVTGTPALGDQDGIMTIIFEIPDTVSPSQPLYIGINSPGYGDGNFDTGSSGTTEFYLVGGSGAFSHPGVKRLLHTTPTNIASALEGGTQLDSFSRGNTNEGWVYFNGVYPTQGEYIGNKYYFRVVVYDTGSNKNAFQVELSTTTDPTPTPISGVLSFSYRLTLALGDRVGTVWNFYPFVPDNATGNIVFYNFEFDNDETIDVYDYDNNLYLPAPPTSGDNAEASQGYTIPALQRNKTWRYEITEDNLVALPLNPGEIWVRNSVSGELYRIYSDAVDYSAFTPFSVSLSAEDGQALVGGVDSETLTLQILDSSGTPLPYSRNIYVTVDNGANISTISDGTNNITNALITTNSDGTGFLTVTKGAPAGTVTVTAYWNGSGGSDNFGSSSSSSATISFLNGLPPSLSAATNSSYPIGGASTALPLLTITIPTGPFPFTTANDIEIKIPDNLYCTFDNTVSTVTVDGDSMAPTAHGVSYKSGDRVAVINLTGDLSGNSWLTISGLKLNNFSTVSSGQLLLSSDGGTSYPVSDNKWITIYDNSPPVISTMRSVVGSNKIYVEFNVPVYRKSGGAITAADFTYTSNSTPVVSLSLVSDLTGADRIFIFETSAPLTDENIVADTINANSSAVMNSGGIKMLTTTYPLSDIGIDFFSSVELQDLTTKGGNFSITTFDGSEKVSIEALRVVATVNVNYGTYIGKTPVLHYNSFPTLSQAAFWDPAAITEDGAVTGRSIGTNSWEFLISGSDSRLVSGNELSLVFSINGLYCYRAPRTVTDPAFSPNDAEAYRVRIQSIISQSGGVTILNNVINPNNGDRTTLRYTLESAGPVSIVVYDLKGNVVKVLVNYAQDKGEHSVDWTGDNLNLRTVARGVYFIRVRAPGIPNQLRKVLVIK